MSFITLVLGIVVGVMASSVIMMALMMNKTILTYFGKKYLKVIEEVTEIIEEEGEL